MMMDQLMVAFLENTNLGQRVYYVQSLFHSVRKHSLLIKEQDEIHGQ